MAKEFDLSVIFKVVDKATNPIKKIGRVLNTIAQNPVRSVIVAFRTMSTAINKRIRQIGRNLSKLGKRLRTVGRRITDIGKSLALRLTAPIAAMGIASLKSSIDFETAFTGVRKTVTASEEEFEKLAKTIRGLALKIPVDTTELSKIGEIGGQLEVPIEDLESFILTIAKFGASTDALTTDEAAIGLARFRKITNSSQKSVENFSNTIVGLANDVAVNEKEILDLSLTLAPMATQAGISTDQILGLAAALGSVGIQAGLGGTNFGAVIIEMQKAIGKGGQTLIDFAEVAGKSTQDFARDFKKDAAGSIIEFTERIAILQKRGKNIPVLLDRLGFDGRRVARVLLAAAGSGDSFNKTLKLASKLFRENDAATKEANKRWATTASKFKVLLNRIKDLAIGIGDILKPKFDELLEALTPIIDNLRSLDDKTKKITIAILLFAAAIPGLVIALGFLTIAIGSVTTALGVLGLTASGLFKFIGIGLVPILLLFAAWAVFALTVLNNWDDLKEFFLGFGKDVLSALAGDLEPLKAFFDDLANFIIERFKIIPGMLVEIFKDIPNLVSKSISGLFKSLSSGLLSFPELKDIGFKLSSQSGPAPNNAAAMGRTNINKSQADIKIRVVSDKGSTATIEEVRKPKDNAINLDIATAGFVGAS